MRSGASEPSPLNFQQLPQLQISLDPINPHEVLRMATKQSTDKTSSLAGKILSGSKKATQKDAKSLAASVLSQDEKKGARKK
jgi:hypothetical protein